MVFLSLWLWRWVPSLALGEMFPGFTPHSLSYLDATVLTLMFSKLSRATWFRHLFLRLDLGSSRKVFLYYLLAVALGAFALILPISVRDGQSLGLLDGFFISVSALAVTGLTPVNVSETFTLFGQSILLVLIQIGGLGVVVIVAALSIASFRRMTLDSSKVCRELYDIPDIGKLPEFLARVVAFTLLAEIVGAALIYFALPQDLPNRLFHALFHAVSAFCNAGFSTFPRSLEMSAIGTMGMTTLCALIVLGGLGFPVLFEIGRSLRDRGTIRRISSNSRLAIWVTFGLLAGGLAGFFLLESGRTDANLPWIERLREASFYSVSSRTAGFNSLPLSSFHQSTILLLIALMIVGASPVSTGGGVKTTTLGVLIGAIVSYLRGSQKVEIFHRSVPTNTLIRAITQVGLYALVVGAAYSILLLIEPQDPIALLFECVSALSTVGLSLDVTPQLGAASKILLMALMIVGRVGLLAVMYASLGPRETRKISYPEDHFFVG
jgi:trk system potassium uptake protein TrkH